MGPAQVIDVINRLEMRYPVATWTIDGVHVWPILRLRIFDAIIFHYLLAQDPQGGVWRKPVNRFLKTPDNLIRQFSASLRDWRKTRVRMRPADAFILSDGTSMTAVEGLYYDRMMDPVGWALEKRGMSSFIMAPGWQSFYPRYAPSMFIQPRLDFLKVLATLRLRLFASPRNANLQRLGDLLAELRAAEPGVGLPPDAWIFAHFARIKALSRFFGRALAKARPRIAFVNTYYSAEGLALCLACRRSGIPVADIQHGSQGRDHVAYGRWLAIPPGGYEMMPDRFWCWGEDERAAVEEWSEGTQHKAVVTGNSWEAIWHQGGRPFVDSAMASAADLRARHSGHHILVTLSWGFSDEEAVRIFQTAAAMNREQHFWWIRLHPVQVGQMAHFAALARRAGLTNFEIELATRLPLHASFSVVDLVVAPGSTTVMEAEKWGLRSVVTSEYGADVCKSSIASGAAVAATRTELIADAIARSLQLGRLPAGVRQDADLTPALEELLGLSGRRPE